MPFTVTPLAIPDVKLITPDRHGDERGYFSEVYAREAFAEHGITDLFVQDNHAFSASQNVLRGLHFQAPPSDQGKLVRVVSGGVLDVAVDIRKTSPTYGQHVSAYLSADNGRQLWVPRGFAHGYCTCEPDTAFLYKVTAPYAPQSEGGLPYDDPDLSIDWQLDGAAPILSEKDQRWAPFKEFETPFP